MNIRTIIITIFFASVPLIAQAEASVTYDGCFERVTDTTVREIWMQAPVCTISVESAVDESVSFAVKNLDPKLYAVTTGDETLAATRTQTSLLFSDTVDDGSQTYTVRRWDYDEDENDFWFAAISDPQPKNSNNPNTVFINIMEYLGELHPNFVINAGDLITGYPDDDDMHEWEYEAHDAVLDDFAGSMFAVPGDHDAENDLDEYYSAFFGERNFSFTYGNTRFIGVNSVENLIAEGTFSDDLLEWLESELAANTSEHVVVYWHHPLVPPVWANSIGVNEDQRQTIAELLVEYNVELLVTGDAHGYDYSYIDDEDFEGLNGGFYQLVAGGAGGRNVNYNEYTGLSHFFVMLHVTDEGIEPVRYEYDDYDFIIDSDSQNDGTESAVSYTWENNNAGDMEFVRNTFAVLAPSSSVYAFTEDNLVYPVTSYWENEISYGYIDWAPEVLETQTFSVRGEQRAIIGETQFSTAPAVQFETVPEEAIEFSSLSVTATDAQTTVTISSWDTSATVYSWEEQTDRGSETTYSVSSLLPQRQYRLYVQGELQERVTTDQSGVGSFSVTGAASRSITLSLDTGIIPTNIGVLPSGGGGANFQMYSGTTDLAYTDFVYSESLEHGFESVWIDIDGDNELEYATVPEAGVPGHVRIFDADGDVLKSFYPYGSSYSGGIQLLAADVEGDGQQELITAPQSNRKSLLKVYTLRDNGKLRKKDSIRAFGRAYEDGISIAAADVDGDSDQEIIVVPHTDKQKFQVYKWLPNRQMLRKWITKRPFPKSHDNLGKGYVVAAGDTDFDGKDEVVIGSRTGNSQVRVFELESGNTMSLLNSGRAFEKEYLGGVQLAVGNINNTDKEEILVYQTAGAVGTKNTSVRDHTRLRTLVVRPNKSKMRKHYVNKPFGKNHVDGIHIGLADVDGDWKEEIIVAKESGQGKLKVYNYRGKRLRKVSAYYPYSQQFNGGIQITQ